METPQGIKQAIITMWATIAISAIAALVNKWLGHIQLEELFFSLVLYGLMCLFPYKLNKGSNPTRYVYAVFTAITFLLLLGGIGNEIPRLDFILSIVLAPVEIFILYRLFQREASSWFALN